MGVPDDAETPLFEESQQYIGECLAKAAAQEHWRAVRASVDDLVNKPSVPVSSPQALPADDGEAAFADTDSPAPSAQLPTYLAPLPVPALRGPATGSVAAGPDVDVLGESDLAADMLPLGMDILDSPIAQEVDQGVVGTADMVGFGPPVGGGFAGGATT